MRSVPFYDADGVAVLDRGTYPSYENLARMADRGLSSAPTDGHGKPRRFKSYRMLSRDPLIEVAFDCLDEFGYMGLILHVGYPQWQEEARADWVSGHGAENVSREPQNAA